MNHRNRLVQNCTPGIDLLKVNTTETVSVIKPNYNNNERNKNVNKVGGCLTLEYHSASNKSLGLNFLNWQMSIYLFFFLFFLIHECSINGSITDIYRKLSKKSCNLVDQNAKSKWLWVSMHVLEGSWFFSLTTGLRWIVFEIKYVGLNYVCTTLANENIYATPLINSTYFCAAFVVMGTLALKYPQLMQTNLHYRCHRSKIVSSNLKKLVRLI